MLNALYIVDGSKLISCYEKTGNLLVEQNAHGKSAARIDHWNSFTMADRSFFYFFIGTAHFLISRFSYLFPSSAEQQIPVQLCIRPAGKPGDDNRRGTYLLDPQYK